MLAASTHRSVWSPSSAGRKSELQCQQGGARSENSGGESFLASVKHFFIFQLQSTFTIKLVSGVQHSGWALTQFVRRSLDNSGPHLAPCIDSSYNSTSPIPCAVLDTRSHASSVTPDLYFPTPSPLSPLPSGNYRFVLRTSKSVSVLLVCVFCSLDPTYK